MTVKVEIEAGHGLTTGGKQTPYVSKVGRIIKEWEFNNKVVLAAIEELNKYEGVEILRTDDVTGKIDVPLNTRTNKANQFKADITVSVHANANRGIWENHTGTETFVHTSNSSEDMKLANIIHPLLVKSTGLRDRGIKKANLHMVNPKYNKAKAKILVETGFMDSTIDINYLLNDQKLKETGIAIAQGIAKYANLKLKQVTKPIVPTKPTIEGGTRKLKLENYQRNEMVEIYKKLQDKKVFTTDWSSKLKKDDVTVDDAIYLLHTMIDRLVLK